jgi:tetratricopeptide (TPR) repeat protein
MAAAGPSRCITGLSAAGVLLWLATAPAAAVHLPAGSDAARRPPPADHRWGELESRTRPKDDAAGELHDELLDEDPRAVLARAFGLAYDLDYEQAWALLAPAVAARGGDAELQRGAAALAWMEILFRRGAVTVEQYLGSLTKPRIDLQQPPPELAARFRTHIDAAIRLAEQEVARRPRDPDAHYRLGAAIGLHASYVATVEGRVLAALRSARRAYDAHERVLVLDPSRLDAGLVVGTYRYLIASLALPLRVLAYAAGFGGDGARGLRMVEAAAAHAGESTIEARFALIMLYNRERRFDDALRTTDALRRAYPRNRLLVLEAGATALRAGDAGRAEAVLTGGLARLAGDPRPRIPGEEALWHYARGAALVRLGRGDPARADLQRALDAAPPDWVRGRVHVELGKLADLDGQRDHARSEYARAIALCGRDNDPACAAQGRRLQREAYRQ